MNRNFSFLAAILIAVCVITEISLVNANSQNADEKLVSNVIPGDILKIFQGSCVYCHATGGKKMAMSKVNFSEWDSYTPEKQSAKAANIVKMLKKGAMPPKSYRQSHPESIPTQDQIDNIVKWSESLVKK